MKPVHLAGLSLVLVACNGDVSGFFKPSDPSRNLAFIEVDPPEVDFGERTSRDRAVETITITNMGLATLTVDELQLTAPTSYELLHDALPWDLAPSESRTFDVAFQPAEGGALGGIVKVLSNADDHPEVDVPLAGLGAIAALEITPDPLDMGQKFIPCEVEKSFTLINRGTEPITITALGLAGEATQLSLPRPPALPLVLQQNRPYELLVDFVPSFAEEFTAWLEVESNDPGGTLRVDVLGAADYPATLTEVWEVPEQLPVNIAFAIDQSCSMSEQQTALANNVASFVHELEKGLSDWKIGVTSGESVCFTGGVITPSTPNWQAAFRSAVIDPPSNNMTERLLAAMANALWDSARQGPPACNSAFQSPPGTPLHVVILSDERDQSQGYPGGSYWVRFVDDYRNFAGPGATVRVHAIVDLHHTPGCSDTSPGPGGYSEAAVATGGLRLDICNANWAQSVANIAKSAVADLSSYAIRHTSVRHGNAVVDPASLRVTYDGVEQTTGWSWDAVDRKVRFDPLPPEGAVVEITFGIASTCGP